MTLGWWIMLQYCGLFRSVWSGFLPTLTSVHFGARLQGVVCGPAVIPTVYQSFAGQADASAGQRCLSKQEDTKGGWISGLG